MATLHVVPNAHIDPAWLWDWREGLNEGLATCHAVVRIMEENPRVTFTRNEAFVYEHLERHDPDLFRRIRRLFEAGRWEITGGAMLQPDTVLASGESYVRQYLYGQKYFLSRFGVTPEIVYQVDSFGHAAGLPTIYHAAGCRYAVQCRPSQAEMPTPSRLFRWRGPDGAEILTANLESYGLEYEAQDPDFTFPARVRRAALQTPPGLDDWLLLAGFGDHGGGLTRQLVAQIEDAIQRPPAGCQVRFSTLREFFAAVAPRAGECPVVEGELQYCFRGCYTSAAAVKRAYRSAENLTARAERLSAGVGLLDLPTASAETVGALWLDVLFNQFHDILPGSSVARVCAEALDHLGGARHQARRVENEAALALFSRIDTAREAGTPVLLLNPHGQAYRGPVEVEWLLDYRPLGPGGERQTVHDVTAVGPAGNRTPTQFLPTECVCSIEWRVRSCFHAEIPACGYAVYWLQRDVRTAPPACPAAADNSPLPTISNRYLRVTVAPGENGIRVFDQAAGRDWFSGPAGAAFSFADPGDSWGSGITAWETVAGEFQVTRVEVMEQGPLKASLLVESRLRDCRVVQQFALYCDEPRLHCHVLLEWNAPQQMLKLVYPFAGTTPRARFSAAYTAVERPPGRGEVPATEWVAVGAGDTGWGIATTGGQGFDFRPDALRLSIVRSPWYGSQRAAGQSEPPARPFMDAGHHEFDYVLAGADDVARAGRELNMPVVATLGFGHQGCLPCTQSLIQVEPAAVELVAFKKAEDGNGWILRLREAGGMAQTAEVRALGSAAGRVPLRPAELVTVRLCGRPGQWRLLPESLTENGMQAPG